MSEKSVHVLGGKGFAMGQQALIDGVECALDYGLDPGREDVEEYHRITGEACMEERMDQLTGGGVRDMLTEKDEQGNWRVKGLPWKDLNEGKPITREVFQRLYACLWKLMEYEDTGMTPDQAMEMKDDFAAMGKTQARRRLDTYIDTCLDCDGTMIEDGNCYKCHVIPKVIETVREIREERRKGK